MFLCDLFVCNIHRSETKEGVAAKSRLSRNTKTFNSVNLVRVPRHAEEDDYDIGSVRSTLERYKSESESRVSDALPFGEIAIPPGYNKYEIPKHPCKSLYLNFFSKILFRIETAKTCLGVKARILHFSPAGSPMKLGINLYIRKILDFDELEEVI